jgi:hypothetical protein
MNFSHIELHENHIEQLLSHCMCADGQGGCDSAAQGCELCARALVHRVVLIVLRRDVNCVHVHWCTGWF